ncbi:MAG: hypothetical protein ACYTGH_05855 [Planctomycetota bacterium]
MAKAKSTKTFELALNEGKVRITPEKCISIIDVIMSVKGEDKQKAKRTWKRLKSKYVELQSFCQVHDFHDEDKVEVASLEHTLEVIMLLPGDKAARIRQDAAIVLSRYIRGDITLAEEIISRHAEIDSWEQFHDRLDLTKDSTPDGYFCIVQEAAPLMIPLIRSNLPISSNTVPDISIGIAWGKYWQDQNLEAVHGERVDYLHHYPDYYPQSWSNPQHAKAYPDTALHIFRKWIREIYLPNHLPKYLEGKVRRNQISKTLASNVIGSIVPKRNENES